MDGETDWKEKWNIEIRRASDKPGWWWEITNHEGFVNGDHAESVVAAAEAAFIELNSLGI